jgi:DNA mismatch repair protein MSH5
MACFTVSLEHHKVGSCSVNNERLDTIGVFLRPDNDSALDRLVNAMKNVGNMRVTIISIRKGIGGTMKGKGGFSRSVWSAIRGVSTYL